MTEGQGRRDQSVKGVINIAKSVNYADQKRAVPVVPGKPLPLQLRPSCRTLGSGLLPQSHGFHGTEEAGACLNLRMRLFIARN